VIILVTISVSSRALVYGFSKFVSQLQCCLVYSLKNVDSLIQHVRLTHIYIFTIVRSYTKYVNNILYISTC